VSSPLSILLLSYRKEAKVSIFPTKILLATDGSKEAELASLTAVNIANATNSELHVIAVGPYIRKYDDPAFITPTHMPPTDQELLDEQVERIKAAGGNIAQAHLKMGGAAEEIVKLGEEIGAGLIVIGSRGLGGMRRALMGSISDSVVRHAHCPVLVVRKEERDEVGPAEAGLT
jgi:nucleotide-binding universal stress UspA family protein